MGQRSQLYIRIADDYNEKPKLFAKYFQWNFAERMISRARYGIEYIKDCAEYLASDTVKERINKIFDVNFDMKDVAISVDIIKEWIEFTSKYYGLEEIIDYIFNAQDNNDGKLFIDVDKKGNIKYCLTDYDFKILSPKQYMNWDFENWENSEYLEDVEICKRNIEYINKNAKQMTQEELQDFMDYDYSEQVIEMAEKLKITIKKEDKIESEVNQIQDEIDICE